MRKHMVIRTVTVTVSEIVEAEMDPQDVKDLVDTKTKSLAGVLSDLGFAQKYNPHFRGTEKKNQKKFPGNLEMSEKRAIFVM